MFWRGLTYAATLCNHVPGHALVANSSAYAGATSALAGGFVADSIEWTSNVTTASSAKSTCNRQVAVVTVRASVKCNVKHTMQCMLRRRTARTTHCALTTQAHDCTTFSNSTTGKAFVEVVAVAACHSPKLGGCTTTRLAVIENIEKIKRHIKLRKTQAKDKSVVQ